MMRDPHYRMNHTSGLRISYTVVLLLGAMSVSSLVLSLISIINLFQHTEGVGHPSVFEFPSGTYRSDFDEDVYIWFDENGTNAAYFRVYRGNHLHSNSGYANRSVFPDVISAATVPCCKYIAGGARLERTMDYDVDVWNDGSLSPSFVERTFLNSASKWEMASGRNLFGTQHKRAGAGIHKNGRNQVAFGELNVGIDNALAVSAMWLRCGDHMSTLSACPTLRETYEWDMMFDFVNYDWGDASYDPNKVDFESVVIHEFGHPTGLDDLSSSPSCDYSTMSGSIKIGDASKRRVDSDSAQCSRNLYSASVPPHTSQPPNSGGVSIIPSVFVIAFLLSVF